MLLLARRPQIQPPIGGWDLIAHTSQGGEGTSLPIDTSGADLLVATAHAYLQVPIVTDSRTNAWTRATDAGLAYTILYCAHGSVGPGHTFTLAGAYGAMNVAAFFGAAANPFDREISYGQLLLPSQDGTLIVAFSAANTVSGVGSGFQIVEIQPFQSGINMGSAMAYLVQPIAAAVNPSWDSTGPSDLMTSFLLA